MTTYDLSSDSNFRTKSILTLYFRHFGDLGNIWRDESGVMDIEIFDSVISLDKSKESYIGGRALVLHELPDDFTGASGNAGSRLGCCVINHDEN